MGSMFPPRWLPHKSLPPYAYLPGKNPHSVRDPMGHSDHVGPIPIAAEASLSSDAVLWGLDLFNHGYYWEAHEAWEGLWQVADRDGPLRVLFKGLILLSAAGVKIRERKNAAAARHAKRAAALFRQLPDRTFEHALGIPDNWNSIEQRSSPFHLAGNRNAAHPVNAMLNYVAAAKAFFRRALQRQGQLPHKITLDGYQASPSRERQRHSANASRGKSVQDPVVQIRQQFD